MTSALPVHTLPSSMRQRWVRQLLIWHRRLAVIACVGILAWSLSGLLHPIMSALQPQPITFATPAQSMVLNSKLMAPAHLALEPNSVQALRLISIDGQAVYQARLLATPEPQYFSAITGKRLDLVSAHAEQLARHYLGTQPDLRFTRLINGFDDEYVFINRLLPVARVDSSRGDGLRVYVDLFNDRLGSVVDTRKAVFAQVFKLLHNFAPLYGLGLVRDLFMAVLLLATFCAVVMGTGLFFARKTSRRWHRRWHAVCGLGIALSSLAFASSGLWHLLHKRTTDPLPAFLQQPLPLKTANTAPQTNWLVAAAAPNSAALVNIGNAPVWRLTSKVNGQNSVSWHTVDGDPLPEFTAFNQGALLLQHYSTALGLSGGGAQALVTQFNHEYGFIFKRLPVWSQQYADSAQTRLYVDPLDGTLAASIANADRFEGFAFAYFHKAEWLSPLGKLGKDIIVSLFALANALMALSGLWLFSRRPRR
ncbi:PepSY domain-containing protein [Atopomonas sediminilitoris]|uniref:PepSY domain-containing protein n=1 Tax=Atopomonas sediminilitoris TaxID=2919919 RepID=UPI001F4DEF3F|nr:PepSY domain-containing protein [Atopomonas sediminilitoris]MCJ8170807.1 PepSY domain-containing protein [Atopomonas sediminilitoris]